jgi:hypothetical protein
LVQRGVERKKVSFPAIADLPDGIRVIQTALLIRHEVEHGRPDDIKDKDRDEVGKIRWPASALTEGIDLVRKSVKHKADHLAVQDLRLRRTARRQTIEQVAQQGCHQKLTESIAS